jgi:hypothetical protein
MINARPDIVRRYMASRLRARGPLGLRAYLPGMWQIWPHQGGALILIGWEGERLPYPTLDPWRREKRQAAVVGRTPGLSGEVDTFADISFSDGTYHFAVVPFGPAGMPAEIEPANVQTRVFDGGELIGRMPNAPACIQVRRLPGDKPHVTWIYSRFAEQIVPATFEVYVRDEETDFDWNSPTGAVDFRAERTRYNWTGAGLSPGDVRYYTVRAKSATGIKSLIPQRGRSPSSIYNTVHKHFCARLEIPAGPPDDVGTIGLEVLNEW